MTLQYGETNRIPELGKPEKTVVTGGKQAIAATIGLFTAGPLGALAAWGSIRLLDGKWKPWALAGLFAAPVLCIAQGSLLPETDTKTASKPAPAPVTVPASVSSTAGSIETLTTNVETATKWMERGRQKVNRAKQLVYQGRVQSACPYMSGAIDDFTTAYGRFPHPSILKPLTGISTLHAQHC